MRFNQKFIMHLKLGNIKIDTFPFYLKALTTLEKKFGNKIYSYVGRKEFTNKKTEKKKIIHKL